MSRESSWEWDEQFTKKMKSSDKEVAKKAWNELFGIISSDLEKYFYYNQKTNYVGIVRQHLAIELSGKLWEKMHKRLSSGKPFSSDTNIEGYVKRMACNLVNDELRKRKTEPNFVDIDDPWIQHQLVSTKEEDKMLERREIAALLCSHLDTNWERFCAYLCTAGFKPQEIHALTGKEPSEVYAVVKKTRRKLTKMANDLEHYQNTANPIDKKLAFIGDNEGPLTINMVNVNPKYLGLDSTETLLRDLNVKTIEQVYEWFIVLVQIGNITPSNPQMHITLSFTPRDSVLNAISQNKPVDYVDYFPVFDTVKQGKQRQQVLRLSQKVEFSASLQEHRFYNDEGVPVGWEWESPDLHMTTLKAFNSDILHFAAYPQSTRQTINLMRVYLLDQRPLLN